MRDRIVDPPSGWKYGFPKACPDEIWYDPGAFRQFLRDAGYPENELDLATSYVRVWFQEDERSE